MPVPWHSTSRTELSTSTPGACERGMNKRRDFSVVGVGSAASKKSPYRGKSGEVGLDHGGMLESTQLIPKI